MADQKVTPEHIKQAAALLKQEHVERLRLEKVAQAFEMKDRAQKLAFREVELGVAEPFKTYDEYQQKVASLMTENLDIVEKALERGYGSSRKDGELAGESGKTKNPFEHYVLTGELVTE
jgi:transcriptional regulator GlxA family with amidase domain